MKDLTQAEIDHINFLLTDSPELRIYMWNYAQKLGQEMREGDKIE